MMPAITRWYSVQVTFGPLHVLNTALQLNKTQAEGVREFLRALTLAAPDSQLTFEIAEVRDTDD